VVKELVDVLNQDHECETDSPAAAPGWGASVEKANIREKAKSAVYSVVMYRQVVKELVDVLNRESQTDSPVCSTGWGAKSAVYDCPTVLAGRW